MDLNKDLLHTAEAEVEDTQWALELIRRGADANATDEDGLTALHLAAYKGHYFICKTLLENGAAIITVDNCGCSALRYATSSNHENVVRLLLENASDLNLNFVETSTILHKAIREKTNPAIISLLIEHGANVNHVFQQRTPLHLACQFGREDVVEILLHNRANIASKDEKGKKPFDIAKDKHFKEIVDMFEKDYPLWIRLYHASRQGQLDECEALLKVGALVDYSQYGLYCPVAAASNEGHYQIVELLLSKRRWMNQKDNNERNPLYLATKKDREDIASLLMDKGACPHIKVKGDSLLHVATRDNHEDLVRLLIRKGLNPNIKNNDGYTSLHYAAANGNGAIVTRLIDNGANVNLTTNKMETPLHLACEGGHQQTLKILVNNKAHRDALNDRNEKPIDIVNLKWLEMKKLLAPQIAEEPTLVDRGYVIVDGFIEDYEDTSGEDSNSDASVDYSVSTMAPIKRHLSGRIIKPRNVKELQSKMARLSDLILKLNEMTMNLAFFEEDLSLERDVLRNLNRKIERTGFLKDLKEEDSNVQGVYDGIILELTRKMDESERKATYLADEVVKFQTEIQQLRTQAKNVYRQIAPFIS